MRIKCLVIPEKTVLKNGLTDVIYSAVGIDHYLVGAGDTRDLALDNLCQVICAQLLANAMLYIDKPDRDPALIAGPAPYPYYEAFSRHSSEQAEFKNRWTIFSEDVVDDRLKAMEDFVLEYRILNNDHKVRA
jgi:hypothetical protein